MSRWRAVWLVARREILERGRSRAFLAALGLTVALILAGIFLPSILAGPGADAEKLGIVGAPPAEFQTRIALVADQAGIEVTTETVPDVATGEAELLADALDGLLVMASDGSVPTFVVKEAQGSQLAQIVNASLSTGPALTLRELEPSDPNRDASFIFANVGVILLFISIFTFGTWVLTGVVEEKQSRVVEVVLSTVQPRDLLVGKVLGIGMLGLAQLVIMVTVGLVAGTSAGRFTLPPTTAPTVLMLLLWFILGYALYSTALGRARGPCVADGGGVERVEPGEHRRFRRVRLLVARRARRPERDRRADRDAAPTRSPDGRPAAGGPRRDRTVGDRPVGGPDRRNDLGPPRVRRPRLLGRRPPDRWPDQAPGRLAGFAAVGPFGRRWSAVARRPSPVVAKHPPQS